MTIFLEDNPIVNELKKYVNYYNEEVIKLFYEKLSLQPSDDYESNQLFLNNF